LTVRPTNWAQKAFVAIGAPATRMPSAGRFVPPRRTRVLRQQGALVLMLRSRLRLSLASVSSYASAARSCCTATPASSRSAGGGQQQGQRAVVRERATRCGILVARRSRGPCSARSKPREPSGQPMRAPSVATGASPSAAASACSVASSSCSANRFPHVRMSARLASTCALAMRASCSWKLNGCVARASSWPPQQNIAGSRSSRSSPTVHVSLPASLTSLLCAL
jgi:hypothetical protein